MASYDLVCDACGNEFEVFVQGFLKDDQKSCPKCGSTETHQKFSSFLSNLGSSSVSSPMPSGISSPSSPSRKLC